MSRADVPLPAPVLENDSDIEAELDLPNWQKLVSHDQIKRLKPKERKRQDTINGEWRPPCAAGQGLGRPEAPEGGFCDATAAAEEAPRIDIVLGTMHGRGGHGRACVCVDVYMNAYSYR